MLNTRRFHKALRFDRGPSSMKDPPDTLHPMRVRCTPTSDLRPNLGPAFHPLIGNCRFIVRWHAQLLVTGTCHVWMGAVGSDGYGRIAIRNREDGARTLTPHQ